VSACDELRANAAGIAALPAGDPEREAYLAHARACAGCMEALREGEKVVAALGSAGLPPPSSRALQRASAPILAELAPSRWRLRAAAVLAAFAVPMLFSRNRDWEGWAAALLALVLATVLSATAGVFRAGAWVALAASAGFAIAGVAFPASPDRRRTGGAHRTGLLRVGDARAAVTAGAVLWREGRSARSLPAVAAAGALAAQQRCT